jgi:phage replication initiation protein
VQHRTKVDWYAGRTQTDASALTAVLAPAFGEVGQWLNLEQKTSGWMGYECSAVIRVADLPAGMVAWGGGHQRGWTYVSLTGQGCDWVKDWDLAQDCFGQLAGWEARRVDIALDTFKRESSVEAVLEAYSAGAFATTGRPPKCRWTACNDPQESRKVTVGERSSGKYLRAYEKGLQLAAAQQLAEIDGVPAADWFRVELELKAKEAPLPVDLVDRRDQYFAGAYPYLQRLLSDVEPEILIQTRERVPQLYLADALANIRRQWGPTLYTALRAYGGDIGAVWDSILGDHHSQTLLDAGVLLVEHATTSRRSAESEVIH